MTKQARRDCVKEPIFLEPVFQEKIWGGTALNKIFGYDIPSSKTGECWAISGHANGSSIVKNGSFKGESLDRLWGKHPEVFGDHLGSNFPLLVKILDARENLSIQVHPDDEYAKLYENGEYGKTECWYVLDCHDNAEIVLGHNAKTKEELIHFIQRNEWDKLLKRVPIKRGDFFYVPSGTIHALCKDTLILEIQQSSDITYRLYDYDREDHLGNKRELHLRKAIEVVSIPQEGIQDSHTAKNVGKNKFLKFIETKYFTICKWEINEQAVMQKNKSFLLVSIINGKGTLTIGSDQLYELNKGDHLILPANLTHFCLNGEFEAIVSHP
ncbi:mannose-6-phosphate isomerase [Cytobacillus firmus]|nr:mannose-6-phosphate isomerase [Cytobacillus firmus]